MSHNLFFVIEDDESVNVFRTFSPLGTPVSQFFISYNDNKYAELGENAGGLLQTSQSFQRFWSHTRYGS